MRKLGPLAGLLLVFLLFSLWAGPPFYSRYNQVTMLTQSVIVAAGALGMNPGCAVIRCPAADHMLLT